MFDFKIKFISKLSILILMTTTVIKTSHTLTFAFLPVSLKIAGNYTVELMFNAFYLKTIIYYQKFISKLYTKNICLILTNEEIYNK